MRTADQKLDKQAKLHGTFSAYVRLLADCLDLRDWDIITKIGDIDADTLATCEATYGQRRARICITDTWQNLSPVDLRSTIVHELIHCHLGPLGHLIDNVASNTFKKQAEKVFDAAYTLEMEHATDAIACAVAKYLPLFES